MKDRNIVVALNRVLEEYFKVGCHFVEFRAHVETECRGDTSVLQGIYESELLFFAGEALKRGRQEGDAVYLYNGEKIGDNFKYSAVLCYNSRLRKKLLKAMLKHSGE